jgi:transcriptional regulator with XRE-family HTH domain
MADQTMSASTTPGSTLKRVREEKGMSQREVARAAGISQSTYSDLERGESMNRSLEIFGRVAQALGVSADRLLGYEEVGQENEGRGAGFAGLTELEEELLTVVRDLRPQRRHALLQIARDLHDEEVSTRRHMALLREIEALDKTGLFERSRERLFQLAAELGSMRAAVPVLKRELEAERAGLKAAEELDEPGDPA